MTLLFALPATGLANDADLRRCRGLGDAAARLACYDAIALPSAGAPAGRSGPAPGPAGPAAAASAPAPAPRPAPSLEAQFGLAARPADELGSIQSHIPGLFEGWRPNERIRLANGQVWQIADDSTSLIQRREPRVTIRRGALGAFYLDIEGDNRSPRVRRIQ